MGGEVGQRRIPCRHLSLSRRQVAGAGAQPILKSPLPLRQPKHIAVSGRVLRLQNPVLGLQLRDGSLELVNLGRDADQGLVLLLDVEIAAIELALELRRLPERVVLLLSEVPHGLCAEPRDLLQGQRQAVHGGEQLPDLGVLGRDLRRLLIELVVLALRRDPQALRVLVLLPQIRLGTGEVREHGLAMGAMQRSLHRMHESGPAGTPRVPIPSQSLSRRPSLRDELRVGRQLAHEALQRLPVIGLDEPTSAVLLDVTSDDLGRSSNDGQPTPQVVDLPEAEVDLPLRVGRHQVKGDRATPVLLPQRVDGDHARELDPLVVLRQGVSGVEVLLGVRPDPVLPAVQPHLAHIDPIETREQVPQTTRQVGPGPEHTTRHKRQLRGLHERRSVRRPRDGNHPSRLPGAVHPGKGEQRQMKVLLALIAEQEAVRALNCIQNPHGLAGVTRAGLELLLQKTRREEVEDDRPATFLDVAGGLDGLDEHGVGIDLADGRLKFMGLGVRQRVAGSA